ncbi:hypothetical protein COCNU_scaffold000525G000080 [Cocos nucifera]|nr:hypothetical protein [Cocos nucifera]
MEDKVAEVEILQGVLQKEEFILAELKAALALEERRKEAKGKAIKLEAREVKSVLEVVAHIVEEFKASFKIKKLNVAFG